MLIVVGVVVRVRLERTIDRLSMMIRVVRIDRRHWAETCDTLGAELCRLVIELVNWYWGFQVRTVSCRDGTIDVRRTARDFLLSYVVWGVAGAAVGCLIGIVGCETLWVVVDSEASLFGLGDVVVVVRVRRKWAVWWLRVHWLWVQCFGCFGLVLGWGWQSGEGGAFRISWLAVLYQDYGHNGAVSGGGSWIALAWIEVAFCWCEVEIGRLTWLRLVWPVVVGHCQSQRWVIAIQTKIQLLNA